MTYGPVRRQAQPFTRPLLNAPIMFPLNSLHMPVRVGGDPSLPGSCEGTSFTGYGRSALGAPSAFPQVAYPGIEAPSKEARNTGPTFVHPKKFHRISLDLGMIIHPWLKAPRSPWSPQCKNTLCLAIRLSKRAAFRWAVLDTQPAPFILLCQGSFP